MGGRHRWQIMITLETFFTYYNRKKLTRNSFFFLWTQRHPLLLLWQLLVGQWWFYLPFRSAMCAMYNINRAATAAEAESIFEAVKWQNVFVFKLIYKCFKCIANIVSGYKRTFNFLFSTSVCRSKFTLESCNVCVCTEEMMVCDVRVVLLKWIMCTFGWCECFCTFACSRCTKMHIISYLRRLSRKHKTGRGFAIALLASFAVLQSSRSRA